jgi:predicted TPR repeat methyltransferase
MDARFEQAKDFFLQGLAHHEAGRYEAAEQAYRASLERLPGRPSTLTNLGATLLKLGRHAEAIPLLEEAVAREPANAQAHGHLAAALAEAGQPPAALDAVRRSLALEPAAGAAWLLRGTLERELGQAAAAAGSFRQALAHGADPELAGYYLAATEGRTAPPAPPRHYVEQLFDAYVDGFDAHLVGALHYRAPELLAQGLAQPRYGEVLDLGCGTGLCAPVLRPRADALVGVDLAQRMVERARARGLYDAVEHADVAEFLAATPRRFDLLVAADVFIYVGALDAVFAGGARVLRPGGEFCFSVEAADEQQTVALRMSLRYAHSERYIRMLAGQHGFAVRATARHPLRIDQGQPVAGLFAWLSRSRDLA